MGLEIKNSVLKHKKSLIILAISLGICFICALGSCLVQNSFGKVDVKEHVMTYKELSDQIKANDKKYGKILAHPSSHHRPPKWDSWF